jgi:heme exporter protein A
VTDAGRPPVLRAEGLVVARRGVTVLSGVELTVGAGDAVCVEGANGSGKTSLIRTLAGLTWPRAGTVVRPSRCAFVPEKVVLGPAVRCGEWLAAMRSLRGLDDLDWRRAVCASGLDEQVLDATSATLSKGMLQRIALLESLHGGCPLLLMDEPFSGLDHDGREWLGGALRERIGAGAAIVVSDHSGAARAALPLTARLRLEGGRCLQCGAGRAVTVTVVATRYGGARVERRVAEQESDALLSELLSEGWHIREVRR